jgi:putative transposase
MSRMPRRQQLADAGCFHVVDRGHDRTPIFRDDDDRHAFRALLARYRQTVGFRLHHFCLMDNHFHLLLRLDTPGRLSALLAGLLRAYIHHCHRRHGFVGHLFQGRFKSPAIQDGPYLLSCGRYVERNPVAAGAVVQPWDYAWSSAPAYACGVADELVELSPAYLELSPDPQRRQQLWREFLVMEDEREEQVRRSDWAVGDEGFRLRMRQLAGRPQPRRRGRPPKTTRG